MRLAVQETVFHNINHYVSTLLFQQSVVSRQAMPVTAQLQHDSACFALYHFSPSEASRFPPPFTIS